MRMPRLICLELFKQVVCFPLFFTPLNTGNNNAARIPMMAMTTSNSIRVNALSYSDIPFIVDGCTKLLFICLDRIPLFKHHSEPILV